MDYLKRQYLKYVDKIYDKIASLDGSDGIAAPELYVAVLLVFNDVNKFSPGRWVNPPEREEVYKLLHAFDTNKDQVLNREEFHAFCNLFLPEVSKKVLRDLIIGFVVTPVAIGLVVTHLTHLKKVLPEAVLASLFVALLGSFGAFTILDDVLDWFIPTKLPPAEAATNDTPAPSSKQD